MNSNSASVLYKETLSNFQQVVLQKPTGSNLFAMIPIDVLGRPDLSASAKLVLGALAYLGGRKSLVAISHEVIAATTGLNRSTVINSLIKLEIMSYIRRSGETVKQIQPYEILHARLIIDSSSSKPEIQTARKMILVRCVRCDKKCRPARTGWCRKCANSIALESQIQRVANAVVDLRFIERKQA